MDAALLQQLEDTVQRPAINLEWQGKGIRMGLYGSVLTSEGDGAPGEADGLCAAPA
jgi:hypothetical protein